MDESLTFNDQPREEIFRSVEGGTIEGYINEQEVNGQPTRVAVLEYVEVDHEFQNQGKGSALVREFAQEAIRENATHLKTSVLSPSFLRTADKVFGRHNLQFPDYDSQRPVNENYDDAMQTLNRRSALEEQYDARGEEIPDGVLEFVNLEVDLQNQDVRQRLSE